ncbi:MAG: glycosyltransferase family 2 protein [Acidimicrobiia bacterium]
MGGEPTASEHRSNSGRVNDPEISVVVPAFNEAAHLEANLSAIRAHLEEAPYTWELVVVDDGSTDGTGAVARKFAHRFDRVKVVEHLSNLGLGQALKSGFRAARGTYLVVCDADLSYDPSHIDRLASTIKTTGARVVVASPYLPEGTVTGVPWLRELLSRGANRLLRMVSNSHVSTVTGMVRAYDREFINGLSLKSVDNQINAEIIYKTDLLRERIVEIPAHLVWTRDEADTKQRRASFSIIRTTIDFLFSGFIFRPFLFFILPGTVLGLLALYSLGWFGYHVISALPQATGSLDNQISEAAAAAFVESPHSLVIGGIAMIFAFQLVSLGIVSAQNKRYFEELYFQGAWLAGRTAQPPGLPHPDDVLTTVAGEIQ